MPAELTSIINTLCNYIRENLVAEGIEVLPDTTFDQLGLDSFSMIEIVLFIERKYDLALPDEALTKTNMHSVTTLADCIFGYLNK